MDIALPSDLSEFVRKQVESGAFASEAAVVEEAVRRLKRETPPETGSEGANGSHGAAGGTRKPIWEIAAELMADLPPEILDQLPEDGAEQHDHYIYGTPKKPR